MSSKTAINRFILFLPLLKLETEATETLIDACRVLCSVRDFRSLQSVAEHIQHPAGLYYGIVAKNQWGIPSAFDIPGMPDYYKARTLLGVGQSLRCCGDLKAAEKVFAESQRLSISSLDHHTTYQVRKEIAILQSLNGDHKGALDSLEQISGLA